MNHDAIFIYKGVGRTVRLSIRSRSRSVCRVETAEQQIEHHQERSTVFKIATGTVSKVGVSSCCYLYSIELVARFVPQLRSR